MLLRSLELESDPVLCLLSILPRRCPFELSCSSALLFRDCPRSKPPFFSKSAKVLCSVAFPFILSFFFSMVLVYLLNGGLKWTRRCVAYLSASTFVSDGCLIVGSMFLLPVTICCSFFLPFLNTMQRSPLSQLLSTPSVCDWGWQKGHHNQGGARILHAYHQQLKFEIRTLDAYYYCGGSGKANMRQCSSVITYYR